MLLLIPTISAITFNIYFPKRQSKNAKHSKKKQNARKKKTKADKIKNIVKKEFRYH